jgi:hypothetical protein
MRIIEIAAMERAREWGACSLNDFRKFLGLARAFPAFNAINWDLRQLCSLQIIL